MNKLYTQGESDLDFGRYLADWSTCMRCPLAEGRHNICHARGILEADFIFLASHPGEYDDTKGYPLLGPAGNLFNEIVQEALSYMDPDHLPTYLVTTTVACAPRQTGIEEGGVRNPTPEEQEACFPRLIALLEIAKPRGIILVGDDVWKSHGNKFELPLAKIKHPLDITKTKDKNRWCPLILEQVSTIYNFFSRNYLDSDH